jgi:hypothetical protein
MSRRDDRSTSLPRPVREAIGRTVLVGAVRSVDALWRRLTGRPTPLEAGTASGTTAAREPAVVRDRLVYALLLGGAARLARRAGLPKDGSTGR